MKMNNNCMIALVLFIALMIIFSFGINSGVVAFGGVIVVDPLFLMIAMILILIIGSLLYNRNK